MRDTVFDCLRAKINIRDEGMASLFLGIKIIHNVDGSIALSQEHYIDHMAAKFNVDADSKAVDTPALESVVLSKDMCPKTAKESLTLQSCPILH